VPTNSFVEWVAFWVAVWGRFGADAGGSRRDDGAGCP
jgi:hypothetical protein